MTARNNNSLETMMNRAIPCGRHAQLRSLLHLLTMSSAAALVLGALFIIVLAAPAARAASNTGRIFGQLLDGSHKNAPVAGQSVTLQMAQGNTASDVAHATSDAHGSFNFANLATDKTISYVLYMHYQGAQYTSGSITLNTKAVQRVNLTVYEATTSLANIAIVRATILLHTPDSQSSVVSVSALYIFRNLDARTYVGSLAASQSMPNALRFSLPHTARNVSLGQGFNGYQAIQVDGGFASDAAVPPGDSQFAFTFDMPYTSSNYDFDYAVVYPTVQLDFLLPPEISASSDSLTSQGQIKSQQSHYSLFQANALLAKEKIHLELAGLPALPLAPATSASTASTPWLLIALLLMAGVLLMTWFMYRAVRRPMVVAKKKRPQQKQHARQQGKTAATKDSNIAEVSESNEDGKDDEQALLQKLLDLDKGLEAGKITRAAYQQQRAKTKARLRSLLREKVRS